MNEIAAHVHARIDGDRERSNGQVKGTGTDIGAVNVGIVRAKPNGFVIRRRADQVRITIGRGINDARRRLKAKAMDQRAAFQVTEVIRGNGQAKVIQRVNE